MSLDVIGIKIQLHPRLAAVPIFVSLYSHAGRRLDDQIRTRVPARALDFEISELSRGARNSK
jgi:hypothetical protein